jgi:uncharacterized protein YqgC (DUF456 family)
MDWTHALVVLAFALAGGACLLAIPIGLPGTWILLALAAGLELGDGLVVRGAAEPVTFGWRAIGIGAALAAAGEALEAAAGVLGAKWGGATRRGMAGAFVGGIAGAIVASPLIPIPLVGTLIGALLGTFGGAFWAEWSAERRRSRGESLRAAGAAVVGRLAGTVGKLAFGVAVWVLLVWTAVFARAA